MRLHHHDGTAEPGLAAPDRARVDPAGLASLGTAAAGPAGLSPPESDEAHRLAGAAGFRGHWQDDRPDSPPELADEQAGAADTKWFATLRARLALAGWTLSRTAAGDGPATYYAIRWGMARDLASLDAVAEFADRVGAR